MRWLRKAMGCLSLRPLLPLAVSSSLDAATTAFAFHFIDRTRYVVFERSPLAAEIVNRLQGAGPLVMALALGAYLFATLSALYALYSLLYRALSGSYRRRRGRDMHWILRPGNVFAMIAIFHAVTAAGNNVFVYLLTVQG